MISTSAPFIYSRRFATSEVKDIDGFQASDFELVGYSPHGAPGKKQSPFFEDEWCEHVVEMVIWGCFF